MIKTSDFKKLKQLDKIEYLLRLKRIEEENNYSVSLFTFYSFFVSLGFLILTFFGVSNLLGLETGILLFPTINLMFKVGIFALVIAFFIDAVSIIKQILEKKRLREEFFKIEVKLRK